MTGESRDSRPGGRVVLVGNDGLGVRVLQELRELGVPTTAVCAQLEAPYSRAARAAGIPLVVGDPEHEDTLREAGVDGASVWGLLGDADLANLHVALELQELAPQARVVLRLFNTSLAGALGGLLGDVTVLSATELAAPAFVEAALRGSVGFELRAGDRQVAVQEVDRSDPHLWLALAEAESEEGEPEIFPVDAPRVVGIVDRGPAETIEPGSKEPAGGLDSLAATQNEGLLTMATRLSRTWWVLIQGTFGILDRRLAVAGAMFGFLIVSSTLTFNRYLELSLLDALYFVVVTVATVGYGDINLLEASAPLKVFGIAMILFGALTLALMFGLVTDAIVGARLVRALGQYPVPRRDHVVVCGVGTTGSTIVEALSEAGVRCVAVERDEDALDAAFVKRLRLPVIIGDMSAGTTLDSLRLGSARALLAVTKDDMANLQCALLAQARAPGLRVVLRMFDPDLAARVERGTGIYLSRSVSALAAPAFVAAIFGRRPAAVLPIGAEVLQIVDLTAERETDVRTLEETCQARVIAVGSTPLPVLDMTIFPGDEMRVVGTSRGLVQLARHAAPSALTATSHVDETRDETSP
jgi:Trk K+ transport system NAD-binding subunit